MPTLQLSDHAIERFIGRVRPDLTERQARQLLEARMDDAQPLRTRTVRGQLRMALSDPDCVLVVRPGRHATDYRTHIVVTILSPAEDRAQNEPDVVDEEHDTAMVPQALRWLAEGLSVLEGQDNAALRAALERLAEVSAPLDRTPAAALLRGFSLLAEDDSNAVTVASRRRLRWMANHLRGRLGGNLAEVEIAAVIRLWREVVRLAEEQGQPTAGQSEKAALDASMRWASTARAWKGGLRRFYELARLTGEPVS